MNNEIEIAEMTFTITEERCDIYARYIVRTGDRTIAVCRNEAAAYEQAREYAVAAREMAANAS